MRGPSWAVASRHGERKTARERWQLHRQWRSRGVMAAIVPFAPLV